MYKGKMHYNWKKVSEMLKRLIQESTQSVARRKHCINTQSTPKNKPKTCEEGIIATPIAEKKIHENTLVRKRI